MNKNIEKVGRKKKNRYSFYLNDEDKEIFLKKVEEVGSIQKFLYKKVFEEEKQKQYDKEFLYHIRKIGITLNQFLKLIYTNKSVQDEAIKKALEEVKILIDKFQKEE